MAEVVASSDEEKVEMVVAEAEVNERETKEGDEDSGSPSSEVVKWEKFLPRMVLRVLLVEADDSTRQIIAALLRKCGYRVAAVRDALMAWETLKGRPHNIDLVLTEVDLPSISGFALLTLVMEHEICKNIPVIMMSSQDSISMVLKCMLKGAADFLIKPVRKNELRNLWQHVWRRHMLTTGQVHEFIPVGQHKIEAVAENNAASNHSSDHATSVQRDKGCSEKASDAQSSCTSPNLEAESTYMQNMQGFSQLNCWGTSNMCKEEKEKHDESVKSDKESVKSYRFGTEVAPHIEVYSSTTSRVEEDDACIRPMTLDVGVGPESDRGPSNSQSGIDGGNNEQAEPASIAIDLIGTFENQLKSIYGHSSYNDGMNKSEFVPQLELSLRRFCSSSSNNQGSMERHTLNHSNASAFSWYNNSKTLQPLFPALVRNATESKADANKSPELLSNRDSESRFVTSQPNGAIRSNNQENMTTLVIGQSGQAELAVPRPKVGSISVSALRFDNISTGSGPVFPPTHYSQSGLAPGWSPKLACQQEKYPFPVSSSIHSNAENYDSDKGYHLSDETANPSVDQNVDDKKNVEPVEDFRHNSSATGQSASSTLCNGFAYHNSSSSYGGICSGSEKNATSAAAVEKATTTTPTPENLKNGGVLIHDGFRGMNTCHSSQRVAALTKFRLKRKDRCYEKKVRYQSRKRLAEQRPRVKGQFVRQVPSDTPVANAGGGA